MGNKGNNFWMKFGYFDHCVIDCCSLIGCQPAEVQHGHNPDTLWTNKYKISSISCSLDPTTNSETKGGFKSESRSGFSNFPK